LPSERAQALKPYPKFNLTRAIPIIAHDQAVAAPDQALRRGLPQKKLRCSRRCRGQRCIPTKQDKRDPATHFSIDLPQA
jgi:hypothetical protein